MINKRKYSFHWGHALIVFFVLYISYLAFIVIKSKTIDHDLVSDQYYKLDLEYQSHFTKLQNTANLDESVTSIYDGSKKELKLSFNNYLKLQKLYIEFYRASDSSQDFNKNYTAPIQNDLIISTKNMISGKWKIKMYWDHNDKQYYKEEVIIL